MCTKDYMNWLRSTKNCTDFQLLTTPSNGFCCIWPNVEPHIFKLIRLQVLCMFACPDAR